MLNTVMNSQIIYKLWNSISTGTAVEFARNTDPLSLLFLMILKAVIEIIYKTCAV